MMQSMKRCAPAAALATVFALTAATHAQWSSDPGTNLGIGVQPGDQNQPKLAPTPDGGAYISWLGNPGGGYNVYLQRIDADGNPQWDDATTLIADRAFSSTQDYGLSVDAAGHALLAFRDDRLGGVRITATRISPDGVQVWGDTGVQLTDDEGFQSSPKIAGASSGSVVVGWTQDNAAELAGLDPDGLPLWSQTLVPASNNFSLSDLCASDAPGERGEVIALIVRQGSFATPRHLFAQKFDASGAPLWGADPVTIFDAGSLQFGNFPTFTPDDSGGMVVAWYQSSPALQCYAQRLDASGAAQFPAGGQPVSTDAAQLRVSPSAAFDPAAGDVYVFWVELNGSQSQFGLYGQRLDAAGTRLWSDTGLALRPLGGNELTQTRTVAVDGGGAMVYHVEALAFDEQTILGSRVDSAGDHVWSTDLVNVSTVASGKSRLDAAANADGMAVLAWSDSRNDSGDIFAQNVNLDGTLGASAPTETVEITASKDNTLIEDPKGALSNGSGPAFFAGRIGFMGGATLRRGVIAFDVADAVPADATIVDVTLQLNLSLTNTGPQTVALKRLEADWGEGDSFIPGGMGAPAEPGDATWLHTFYDDQFWANPGGDFVDVVSSSTVVDQVGFYTWPSTEQLVADVQAWVDDPATNFGWLVQGNEDDVQTAHRFDSREAPDEFNRPLLTVTYTIDAGGIPGDLTGNGVVDGEDLAMLLGAWGPCADCDDCDADIDGTCTVDGADLAILLGNWG